MGWPVHKNKAVIKMTWCVAADISLIMMIEIHSDQMKNSK
jgi:hypothetical protein